MTRQRGTFTSQGWYAAIRGIPGWYNSATIDGGMLYLSTRNQRGIPLDFIPTAVVNELVVNKTVTPEMDPNSVGGHIDVRTLRSFDNDGKPLAMIDGQGVFYTKPGALNNANPSYLINGVIKRTFGPGGGFGFVLAGSTHKDQVNEKYIQSSGYVQRNGIDIPSGNLQQGDYNSRAHGFSVMGKLEGRGERWYGYVAGNYFQENITRDLFRSNVAIVPANVTNATNGRGDFTGATPTALSQIYFNNRKIYSIRGGLEYQTNDTSKIVVNASYLNANFYEGVLQSANFVGPSASGSYHIDSNTGATTLSSTGNLNDPTQWRQAAGAIAQKQLYPLPTDIVTGRIEYKSNNFDFSRGIGFDVGVDYRQMWRALHQYNLNTVLPAGTMLNLSQVLVDGSTFNGADASQPIFVDNAKYFGLVQALGTTTRVDALTSNYTLNERVLAPFASLYFTTDKFRVIAGVRYNSTHFTNKVSTITNGAIAPLNTEKTYAYLLPNVQGYYDLGGGLRIRAAYTQTTALQNYSDFATGITTNLDSRLNPVIQGANPDLKPRQSYNQDLSLEYYGSRGYFSLGYFHKIITNEASSVRIENYDANGVLISAIQQPTNNGRANMHGVEFEGQIRDMSAVSPLLKGLTIDLNGAWFNSETKLLVSQGVTRTIDGFRHQPKWVANLILSYAHGPFTASLAGQARGRALFGIAAAPAQDTYVAPFQTLDGKIGYDISRNLKVYAEARNLTNYWYEEVTGSTADKVAVAIQSGRTFAIGAKLNF